MRVPFIYICMLSICFVVNVSGNDLALEAFAHIGSNHQNYNLFLIWLSYQPSVDHHTPHEKGPVQALDIEHVTMHSTKCIMSWFMTKTTFISK